MSSKLADIRNIEFPLKQDAVASLSIYEHPSHVPFMMARTFVIHAKEAIARGDHAHKECQQLLVCLQGTVIVTVDDGHDEATFDLTSPGQGLLIPAGLWASQVYSENAILMVLASHPYDEGDYIRNYDDYLAYRQL